LASQDWVEKDFYSILGVPKDAPEADIRKAYRKLARKYHPDRNPGNAEAEKKFKDITEANSVLSDPEQRRQYDAIRAMGGARFTAAGPGGGAGAAGFEDLFGGLFSGGHGRHSRQFSADDLPPEFADLLGGFRPSGFRSPPRRGSDRQASTTISFADSIRGTTVGLPEQDGQATEVRIPAGIRDGQKVRVRGKGGPGSAGRGDLIVTVHVRPHPFFTREGDNIRIHVPVTFDEAALGARIEVPTLDGGTVTIKVPPGTNSGRTLRIKGKGVKTAKGAGDLLVTVDVVVPQKLSREAEEALRSLAATRNNAESNPRAGLADKARLY
jgi:molecular chaperone DnaJ